MTDAPTPAGDDREALDRAEAIAEELLSSRFGALVSRGMVLASALREVRTARASAPTVTTEQVRAAVCAACPCGRDTHTPGQRYDCTWTENMIGKALTTLGIEVIWPHRLTLTCDGGAHHFTRHPLPARDGSIIWVCSHGPHAKVTRG